MAHKKPMKNMRLDAALVARAEVMKMNRVADAGLDDSAGTWTYHYPAGRSVNRFRSTTKVVAAALELGLVELEKRFAVTEKEAEAKRHQLALRRLDD